MQSWSRRSTTSSGTHYVWGACEIYSVSGAKRIIWITQDAVCSLEQFHTAHVFIVSMNSVLYSTIRSDFIVFWLCKHITSSITTVHRYVQLGCLGKRLHVYPCNLPWVKIQKVSLFIRLATTVKQLSLFVAVIITKCNSVECR